MSELNFTPFSKHKPGLVVNFLCESYAGLPEIVEKHRDNWIESDKKIFSDPEGIGSYGFVTCLGEEPIGFGSWDARQGPALGIIGQNCILPRYQSKGYGKRQILEILRRFKEGGFERVSVTTGDQLQQETTHFLFRLKRCI
jgi:GNAT superfamily N-acetyltransferase